MQPGSMRWQELRSAGSGRSKGTCAPMTLSPHSHTNSDKRREKPTWPSTKCTNGYFLDVCTSGPSSQPWSLWGFHDPGDTHSQSFAGEGYAATSDPMAPSPHGSAHIHLPPNQKQRLIPSVSPSAWAKAAQGLALSAASREQWDADHERAGGRPMCFVMSAQGRRLAYV